MMWTYGMGAGWMWIGIALLLGVVAFTTAIVFVAIDVRVAWRSEPQRSEPRAPALQLAQERLAKGEIDVDEY